jgi:hypothetical protein
VNGLADRAKRAYLTYRALAGFGSSERTPVTASLVPSEHNAIASRRAPDAAAIERVVSACAAGAVTAAVAWGWWNRGSLGIDPASGAGYALGIFGASAMVVVLIYPLRKRGHARFLGSVAIWFRVHMLLGLLGPLAILYHSRFRYEAINSGVALWSMLIVVASGLIGRYVHRHVYRGFSLQHLKARDLFEEMAAVRAELDADGDAGEHVRAVLGQYAALAQLSGRGFVKSALISAQLGIGTRLHRYSLARELREHLDLTGRLAGWSGDELARHQRDARLHLHRYLKALRLAGGFAFYDRMLGVWRTLHLPLFIFLAIAVTMHIVAVHMY